MHVILKYNYTPWTNNYTRYGPILLGIQEGFKTFRIDYGKYCKHETSSPDKLNFCVTIAKEYQLIKDIAAAYRNGEKVFIRKICELGKIYQSFMFLILVKTHYNKKCHEYLRSRN